MTSSANSRRPRSGEGDRSAQPSGGGVFFSTDNAYKIAKRERRSGNLPEVLVWRELRKRPGGFKFRRQHPLGPYALDFACLQARLAIEIDGSAHDDADRQRRDEHRDRNLQARGFATLRLGARDILCNLEGAIAAIVQACEGRQPLHHQPAAGGPPPRSGEV